MTFDMPELVDIVCLSLVLNFEGDLARRGPTLFIFLLSPSYALARPDDTSSA